MKHLSSGHRLRLNTSENKNRLKNDSYWTVTILGRLNANQNNRGMTQFPRAYLAAGMSPGKFMRDEAEFWAKQEKEAQEAKRDEARVLRELGHVPPDPGMAPFPKKSDLECSCELFCFDRCIDQKWARVKWDMFKTWQTTRIARANAMKEIVARKQFVSQKFGKKNIRKEPSVKPELSEPKAKYRAMNEKKSEQETPDGKLLACGSGKGSDSEDDLLAQL